jgi:hypothetical protein
LINPPELVQPVAAPATTSTSSSAIQNAFRRRLSANGNTSSPHASGTAVNSAGRSARADVNAPVEISTVTEPVAPAFTVVVAGLNRHNAFAGSVPHEKENAPEAPFAGLMVAV